MLDVGYSELLLIAVVALVVIGPKDLPRVLRHVGGWVARARGMARHVRSGFDTMMREAELEEMQKAWAANNAAIMAAHPATDAALPDHLTGTPPADDPQAAPAEPHPHAPYSAPTPQ
jgi:sec-independent protein translocase protein TatB